MHAAGEVGTLRERAYAITSANDSDVRPRFDPLCGAQTPLCRRFCAEALGGTVELFEALKRWRTTNGPFLPAPVGLRHQRLLVEFAAMAPSHFKPEGVPR